jgi:excisionase family DNA binding protein
VVAPQEEQFRVGAGLLPRPPRLPPFQFRRIEAAQVVLVGALKRIDPRQWTTAGHSLSTILCALVDDSKPRRVYRRCSRRRWKAMKLNAVGKREVTATLSVAQAAEVLGMSASAIYAAIAAGRLPARRWHGRVLLLASELDSYLSALPSRPVTSKPSGKREVRDG